MNIDPTMAREWLEADGCGGFASGTVAGIRTRRYHALLLAAATPPTGRVVLVNGFEAEVITAHGRFALSSQHYAPDVIHPDGLTRIEHFERTPWPRWRFHLCDGTRIEQELFAVHGSACVVLRFRLVSACPGVTLELRPLLSGRDYHALHRENPSQAFMVGGGGEALRFQLYDGLPAVVTRTNAEYRHAPEWYRNFLYSEERARGLDDIEDLASPGVLRWDLSQTPAAWIIGAEGLTTELDGEGSALELAEQLAQRERTRRSSFASQQHVDADAYLVARGAGRSIVAGYPWFTDWGRDTFIALRGLCIATGRLDAARAILCEWAAAVSQGMLPNRFADRGEAPEYNSVDASLWYIIAVHELLQAYAADGGGLSARDRAAMLEACEQILSGYAEGTRHGIRACDDGLLACGAPGIQLTWMDAKIGEWVVTPRTGKPVEVQALWLNALTLAGRHTERWRALAERGRASFRERFWCEESGGLYDVIDVDHVPGRTDASFRPNQVLAVGGLPLSLLDDARASRMVGAVEARLLTPVGLRSLAPGEPGYAPHYGGGPGQRDAAYHQGTVWPWLLGPFVEAWVRVRGNSASAKRQARARFLDPVLREIELRGLGHRAEIADAEAPHRFAGCPFQAWSLGEVLRLGLVVLAEDAPQPLELAG